MVYPSVVHLLADASSRYGERDALVCEGARLSYRAYRSCAACFGRELADLGVRGERVAILLPNCIEIGIAMFAAHAAHATVVPLNPLYTARELSTILEDAAPRVLLYDAARRAEIGSITAEVARKGCELHAIPVEIGGGRLTRWAAQEAESPEGPAAETLAFVQYTGGTTGRSKGVMLTHRAVATNLAQREGVLPTVGRSSDPERIVCPMPIFHSYGLVMGLYLAAYCGGTLVVVPRYRPDALLRLIGLERITIFPGSPTIFTGLLAHADFGRTDWSSVHTCYSGSAPLAEETLRRWETAVGAPVYEGYGQTEAGPILTFNPANGVRKPGSVGLPLADTEVQIVDSETGTVVLGPGTKGEIRARGPQIMVGYRNLPEETAQALRGGWLYTGDIGEFDADGYLYIRDRKKDMAIVAGYNVYPREIDEVLMMHPAVLEAATVGVPDAYRGERLRAYVVLRPAASTTAEDLREHCARHLAKFKLPASVILLDALPKTSVNKTDKKALRARGA